jgi:hypothetical protein
MVTFVSYLTTTREQRRRGRRNIRVLIAGYTLFGHTKKLK